MGYPTTVQLIARKQSEQWYVNFPAAIARGLDFKKGEVVEWTIKNRRELVLRRMKRTEKRPAAVKR
jgi:antitoxin component of MazEF toxin-antitoxin module